jgi:hypothetical protein
MSETIKKATYDSDEKKALNEKFGYSETTASLIRTTLDSLATELINSSNRAIRTFKKVKFKTLDDRNLSSFSQTEASQDITVSTQSISEQE